VDKNSLSNDLVLKLPVFFDEFNKLSCAHLSEFIDTLSTYLVGFKRVYDAVQSIRYGDYVRGIHEECFFEKITPILKKSHELRTQEMPDFNVFNMLGIARREVVATAMWKDLLDPKGSHEQGDLFLRPFLELLDDKLKRVEGKFHAYASLSMNSWVSSAEEFVRKVQEEDKDGRVDVYLKHLNDFSAIAIEYKIDASDQERQVSRYHDHLEKSHFTHSHIVYITTTGYKPSKYSLDKLDEKEVLCMSIKYELVPMLTEIIEKNFQIPKKLKYFIKNYIEVAR